VEEEENSLSIGRREDVRELNAPRAQGYEGESCNESLEECNGEMMVEFIWRWEVRSVEILGTRFL
jgi:hypothetical protein